MATGIFAATRQILLNGGPRLLITDQTPLGVSPQTMTLTPNYERGADFAPTGLDHDLTTADVTTVVGITTPTQLADGLAATLDKAITDTGLTSITFASGADTTTGGAFAANGNEYLLPQLSHTRLKLRGDVFRWTDDDIRVLFYSEALTNGIGGAPTTPTVSIGTTELNSLKFLGDLDNEHLVGANTYAWNGTLGLIDTDAKVAANSVVLANKTSGPPQSADDGGVADADNVVFAAVETGTDPVTGILIFKWTGEAVNSPLLCHIDAASGTLPIVPNGGSITVAWDSGVNKIARL